MKKKLSILLALCLLLALPALAYTDNNIIAHRAPGDVTLDGHLGEWNPESAAVMHTAEQVVRDVGKWTDDSDLSVQAYLMWDEENLYLGVKMCIRDRHCGAGDRNALLPAGVNPRRRGGVSRRGGQGAALAAQQPAHTIRV